jgi:hypothetical protein
MIFLPCASFSPLHFTSFERHPKVPYLKGEAAPMLAGASQPIRFIFEVLARRRQKSLPLISRNVGTSRWQLYDKLQ